MFQLSILGTVVCTVFGAIPAKNYTDTRIVDIGVKAITRSEIVRLTACIQEDFWNQKDLMAVGATALSCAGKIAAAKIPQLGLVLPQRKLFSILFYFFPVESCLIAQLSSTMVVSPKVASILYPEIDGFYSKMMTNFTALKKAKKGHDAVLNVGFQMINQRYTRKMINEICLKIAKTMTKPQFNCLITKGKPIIDVTTYDCANYVKSNLLG